jgi:hypothetical protein
MSKGGAGRVRGIVVAAAAVAGLLASAPATAQDVHNEIIQRLDRIEKLLRAGPSGGESREGVRSIADFYCSPSRDCGDRAKAFCVKAGFSAGVVSRTERAGYSGDVRALEVTCVR